TDGQIYLDPGLFDKGILPAIDLRISVSRVGDKAQLAPMRDVAKKLKIEYEHFLEVEVFTKFGAKLDEETLKILRRGERLREILRQDRFRPMQVEEQVATFYAHGQGSLDDIETAGVWPFIEAYLEELRLQAPDVLEEIREGLTLSTKMKSRLDKAIKKVSRKERGDDIEQGTGWQEKELPVDTGDCQSDEGPLGG
ncbi:MAG TPA: hypothetical protein VGK71_04370, partial [Nitrospirota bacterium]